MTAAVKVLAAIRTKDDEVSISWGEYAERVRAIAAGLAALGVGRGDTVGIMLTSGTTGPPKGVQLTHANVMAAFNSFDEILRLSSDSRLISWLPMAHIAERNATHYAPICFGAGVEIERLYA